MPTVIDGSNSVNVKNALNASGEAPIYACRAWVNFDGTIANPTIRASGNVSSVIKNGTGDYTVNFATGMPAANYSVSICADRTGSDSNTYEHHNYFGVSTHVSVSAARVFTRGSVAFVDCSFISVTIFR